MLLKLLVILLVIFVCCECGYVYSSFWAPLFDRRILNYQVDVPFKPEAGQLARERYAKDYGYRGETLIANLGNGRGPQDHSKDEQKLSSLSQSLTKTMILLIYETNKSKKQVQSIRVYGDVKLYYT